MRCQVEVTADQSSAPSILFGDDTIHEDTSNILNTEQELASTRTDRIARGGTENNFKCIRASSEMCIHGPSCQFHCQKMKEDAENRANLSTPFSICLLILCFSCK